jgi:hypothetical protein
VTPDRRLALFIAGSAIAIALVAIPFLVASRGPTAGTAEKTHKPEHAITVHGAIQKTTESDGTTAYTLTANGTTYRLSDGPAWWWGANDPLAAYVGKTVDVIGEVAEGSTDLGVQAIDGKALRAPGRPPWAGGPKVVGEKHPGFKASNAAREKGSDKAKNKGSGKPSASASPSASTSPSASPLPSASPH